MIELEKYIDLSIGKINTSNCIKTLKDLERNRRTKKQSRKAKRIKY